MYFFSYDNIDRFICDKNGKKPRKEVNSYDVQNVKYRVVMHMYKDVLLKANCSLLLIWYMAQFIR